MPVPRRGPKPTCSCGHAVFRHLHDEAHGISGTHIAGSERYVCQQCGKAYFATEGTRLGLEFFIDKPKAGEVDK